MKIVEGLSKIYFTSSGAGLLTYSGSTITPKVFCILLLLYVGIKDASFAQSSTVDLLDSNNTRGIKWTGNLSFQEVQEKARRENKYIFLDCHATWCKPCKDMDKNVFVNDTIGAFFNQYFISVKVQMNKTKYDDEYIKRWYDDSKSIGEKHRIDRFPSYLFFSPKGILLGQETGYKKIGDFLGIAKAVIHPGRVYDDPYTEYDRLVAEYKKGIFHYDRMVFMLDIARRFDTALLQHLTKHYTDYINGLDASKRYTKENIEFLNRYVLRSNSKSFNYFYKDGKVIDRIMGQKGYAAAVVDRTIYYEIVVPFFYEQNNNRVIPMTGMYLSGPGVKTDSSEADWEKLGKAIHKKFNSFIAKRNVLAAKVEWYLRHKNHVKYIKYSLIQLNTYTPDVKGRAIAINAAAWEAFMRVKDKYTLNGYIKWMKKIAIRYPKNGHMLDTYANLLYKVGRKEEAIYWEEKAMLAGSINSAECKIALEQMKRGEPTYGVTIN